MANKKLTRERLRQIIREETRRLQEMQGSLPIREVENAESKLGEFIIQNDLQPDTRDRAETAADWHAGRARGKLREAVDALYDLKESL